MVPKIHLIVDDAPPSDVAVIRDGLWSFNLKQAPAANHKDLTLLCKGDTGDVIGGLVAATYWGWLHIDVLWLSESMRGQHLGRQMVEAAEAEALNRGCRHACLETMSWQAEAFYEKLGYKAFGVLHDFPAGHRKIYMKKTLTPAENRDAENRGKRSGPMSSETTRASYDTVAESYAATFFDEFSRKPFDRSLLDAFAAACADRGRVLDIGCGPGHLARYLRERGVDASGVDLSPAMVGVARRLNPGLQVSEGDMHHLVADSGSLAGIAAFYSLIHVARDEASSVLGEFNRVLTAGGRLLLAVHGGTGNVHRDEFLGHQVPFDATLFQLGEIVGLVEDAGFRVDEARQREPYEFEHPTPRIYVAAHRQD